MPNWAQRASGAPLIRGTGGDFVGALARASAPEEVVRVLFERSAGLTSTSSSLPKPIIQVIEQIKAEARQQDSQSTPTTNGWSPQETGTRRSQTSRVRGGAPRSTARVIRGFTPIKGGGLKKDVAGQDRIMKLAQKLQQLIHLSERNKELARQQVRMAEDSSAAMQEGQQEQGQGEQSDASQVDVDALSSEVLHFVNRELELRRERRLEDVDERNIWW